MAISMYDARVMLKALEQMHPPTSFLLDLFFREENYSLTDTIDVDIMKGNKKLAPFVRPISEGKLVERAGFTTNTIKTPYIKQKMQLNAQDLMTRPLGENIYIAGGMSMQERAERQLRLDLQYLQNLILRREEWMAAQALVEGKITIVGDGLNQEVDFLRPVENTLDADIPWDDATANPLQDMAILANAIRVASGIMPETFIFGSSAIANFLAHESVRSALDNRRFELGLIRPEVAPDYSTYVGMVRVPGLAAEIYTYQESYTDDQNAIQPYIPANIIIAGSKKARTVRQYGVIQDMKALSNAAVRWFPKSWETEDPSARWLMLQSAPLPCIIQTDAFGTMDTHP
jgi:hypothetical protein